MNKIAVFALFVLTQAAFAAPKITCVGTDIPRSPLEKLPDVKPVNIPLDQDKTFSGYTVNIIDVGTDGAAGIRVSDLSTGKTTESIVHVQAQNVNAGAQNLVMSLSDKVESQTIMPATLLIHCYYPAK